MAPPPKSSKLSLEEQFEFYGQYHTNKVNVAIHMVCVPTIFFTALILAHGVPGFPTFPSVSFPLPTVLYNVYGSHWTLNLSTLTSVYYASYFCLLEPVAGLLYAPFILSLGQWSDVLYNKETIILANGSRVPVMQLAGIVFVMAWIAQFIGHGKFEGRAPALLDSLFQSLVLAVFFVWMEALFILGYRPELHRRLQNRIGKAVLAFRQEQARTLKASATALD